MDFQPRVRRGNAENLLGNRLRDRLDGNFSFWKNKISELFHFRFRLIAVQRSYRMRRRYHAETERCQ